MTTGPALANEAVEGFFDDLVRCETRLYNAIGDALQKEHGLTTAQFEFLRLLRRTPQVRVADVAASFAIGVGATSKGIDRLEALGWVERVANPTDRRSSLLQLTPMAERLVDQSDVTFLQSLNDLVVTAVEPELLKDAGRALSVLRAALEERRAGLPTG